MYIQHFIIIILAIKINKTELPERLVHVLLLQHNIIILLL